MVAQSSTKAKYNSITVVTNQASWLRKILNDVGQIQGDAIIIWVDNNLAIAITKNPMQHGRTKHINAKYHAIREAKKNEEINLICCSSKS